MEILPNRKLVGVVTAVSLGLLAGCTAGSQASSNKAQDRVVFTYAMQSIPSHIDLTPYGGQSTKLIHGVLNSTLVRYEGRCDVLGESSDLVPNLAESWEYSADGKSLTFRLGDAVSAWGNEITAEDVKWSVERQAANAPSVKSNLGDIGRFDIANLVEVVDEKTVRFNLTESSSFDVMQFASLLLTIRDSVEAKKHATPQDPWSLDWMRTNTADFGPWKLERFSGGSEVVLEPNPNYDGERGNIDRVVLRSVPESVTRMQLLTQGSADWADALTFNEYDILRADDGIVVQDCVSADRDELFVQQSQGPLSDVRVRRAISLAIDRETIVESVYNGFGAPAKYGVPQSYVFPEPDAEYSYDPGKAKQLLQEAGYGNGLEISAVFSPHRPGPHSEQLAVRIQADLKEVGITMTLNRVPGSAEFFELVQKGRYDVAVYSDSTFVGDAAYGAAIFTLSTSSINSFGYASHRYDSAVHEARRASGDTRAKLIAEVSDIAVEEMPIVYVVDRSNLQAHRKSVSGFQNNPMGTINPAALSKNV